MKSPATERRQRWAAVAAPAALALAASACTDGYPSRDAPAAHTLSAAEHVHALNDMLRHEARSVDAKLALATPCVLRLSTTARGEREQTASLRLETLRIAFSVDERYRVSLARDASAPAPRDHRFVVDDWHDAVAFRSHLQQLQMACAASKD